MWEEERGKRYETVSWVREVPKKESPTGAKVEPTPSTKNEMVEEDLPKRVRSAKRSASDIEDKKKVDVVTKMRAAVQECAIKALNVVRRVVPENMTEEMVEPFVSETMEAQAFVSMATDIKDFRPRTEDQIRGDALAQIIRNQITVELRNGGDLQIVDCGGGGHCGPLSVMGAMKAMGMVDPFEGGVSLEKMRGLAKLQEDEASDEWWMETHFGKVAHAFKVPVIRFADKPKDFTTGISIDIPKNYDGTGTPIMVFGGTGHWQLVVAEEAAVQRVLDNMKGTVRAGTVRGEWKKVGADMSNLKHVDTWENRPGYVAKILDHMEVDGKRHD